MAKAWSPLVHTLEFGMTSTWEKGSAGEKISLMESSITIITGTLKNGANGVSCL